MDARLVKFLRQHEPRQCYDAAVPDSAVLVSSALKKRVARLPGGTFELKKRNLKD